MSIILLIIFVATVLAVQAYLRRRRLLASLAALSSDEVLFHPGHAWVRVYGGDVATVGVSDFAANFAGELISLELPAGGRRLRQGEPAWTLQSEGQRRLMIPMPIDGDVIEVNASVERFPELAQRSPYESGWLLRVRPRRLGSNLRKLLRGAEAKAWLDATRDAVMARLTPAVGALAQDGGEWVVGFGKALSAEDWEGLKKELFPNS